MREKLWKSKRFR